MHIDKIIFDLRKQVNLTQVELADKVGVSSKTISRWEKGLSTPDIYALKELSKALNVSVEVFYKQMNDIDTSKIRVQTTYINQYITHSIISITILLIGYLLFLFGGTYQGSTDILRDIFSIIGLVLIIISLAYICITLIRFHNDTKHLTQVKRYRRTLFIYLGIYLIILLPFIIFVTTTAFS